MLKKESIIRTIYLYLFSLIGLILLIIGTVNFVDMGLKAFVFTQANQEQKINYDRPPQPIVTKEDIVVEGDKLIVELTGQDKIDLENSIVRYDEWQEQQDSFDYFTSRQHQEASQYLAFILIGLPLYLTHWLIIRKETIKMEKKKK